LFLALGGSFEGTQALGPEDLEITPELGDGLRSGAIEALGAVSPLGDQPGLLQDAKVLGDRRPRDVEAAGDVADGELLARHEAKDLAAAGLTEGCKSVDILRVSRH
jgi:hypothetical protein